MVPSVCANTNAIPGTGATESAALIADCNALLAAAPLLTDTTGLNWETTRIISAWNGITLTMTRVTGLSLPNRNLTGTIPAELGNLSALTTLNLYSNTLTGTIPASLANLSTTLQYLRLHSNQLRGQITPSLNVLTNLEEFTISGNDNISECIPPSLWKEIPASDKGILPQGWRGCCAGSQAVRSVVSTEPLVHPPGGYTRTIGLVNDCNVLLSVKDTLRGTGTLNWDTSVNMASWQGILTSLNIFQPTISESVVPLSGAGVVGLRFRTLRNGGLPAELKDLAALQVLWFNPPNDLTGATIPSAWGLGFPDLKILWLGNQRITGTIPAALGNIITLISLSLIDNNLRGPLPPELSKLSNLGTLQSSNSNLVGKIPPELGNLPTQASYWLGGNNFEGCHPFNRGHRVQGGINVPACSSGFNPCYGSTAIPGWSDTESSSLVADCNVLVEAQNSLRGSLNWHTGSLITGWDGISVNTNDSPTQVITLDLSSRNLSGTIPTALGALTNPQTLRVSLPEAVRSAYSSYIRGSLANLQALNLSDNQLSGTIPVELGNLTRTLTTLNLGQNSLTGTVPAWLGDFTKLQTLSLYSNTLTGTIPAQLDTLSNTLTTLNLGQNRLTGFIPLWLGEFTNLQTLSLYSNTLTGTVPARLGNLSNTLTTLNLSQNGLTGTIPAQLGNLSNTLTTLNLSQNRLTGSIPPELAALSNTLTTLNLGQNSLMGPIPSWLGEFTNLQHLHLNDNQLTGRIPPRLYDRSALPHLQTLHLAGNTLTDCIPYNLRETLQEDGLTTDSLCSPPRPPSRPPGGNGGGGGGGGGGSTQRPTCINGTVVANPSANADLVRDCVLLLTNKETLEGSISTSMRLNWSETSSIDTWEGVTISGVPQRVIRLELDISGKTLAGSIPTTLSRLTGLQVLDISNNEFSGRIPVGLRALATLQVLDFSNNRLSGSMPTDLGSIASLQTLHLANNSLTGSIPTTLVDLSNLRSLSLAGNRFSGCIPNALTRVAQNDLSDIELSFCDPVTPTTTPTVTPTATATPLAPVGQDLFLPLVRK